ncbi:MAG: hypothetical protein IJ038_05850 [Clostridia bacterium]|nr:hypothetical protein [Clostridia bacterium]
MYSRYPNYKFANGVRVPDNYSGNAFAPQTTAAEEQKNDFEEKDEGSEVSPENTEIEVSSDSVPHEEERSDESVEAMKHSEKKFKLPGFNFNLGKIFSKGFGFEELLIIGLILLLSQNDTDDDIILLLVLLLFIS